MRVAPRTPTSKRHDFAVVAFFLLVVLAPTVDELVRGRAERAPVLELRTPYPRPEAPRDLAEFERWPSDWERWYGDGFGLRDAFLTAHSALHYFVFQNAPAPMFVVGDDDWVFYRGSLSIDDFRGLVRLSAAERAAWIERLEARRDYLAKLGIRYVFAVAPNKESIYPEHFPACYTRVGATVLDQLVRLLDAYSDVEILDLRPAFLAAKPRDREGDYLYTRDGTHWTPRGSFLAVRALTERLAREFPDAPIAQRAELCAKETPTTDSLLLQMYLGRWFATRAEVLVPVDAERPPVVGRDASGTPGRHLVFRNGTPRAPHVLVFHDSFMPFIERALAPYTAELTLEWSRRFDLEAIAEAHPDVVIDLTVERQLVDGSMFDFFPPSIDPALGFEGTSEVVGRWLPSDSGVGPDIDPAFRPVTIVGARTGILRLELASDARRLGVPEALTGAGRGLRLKVVVEAPEVARLELRYRCLGSRFAEAGEGSQRELRRGRNVLYFDFDRADIEGPIELWLSGTGTALVRELETRCVVDAQGTRK
ncbi:MAG: hypothetical protein HZA52_21845 [Planctomycetes bacterium]|nr:hypothetical protein [Planctomycetota bacterium]